MKKYKTLFAFILGIIVSASITAYALSYYASDMIYKNKTVEEALNELYSKSSAYGIKRQISSSSSVWERTGKSIGLIANAQIGSDEATNDFDDIYPWSDIITVAMDNAGNITDTYDGEHEFAFDGAKGKVMTKIPEFYYLRYQKDGYEYINISKDFIPGYTKSDAFYIGRYTISTGTLSKSGVSPQVNTNITTFRNQAKSLGSSWQLMDYHYFIIQLLYLVEYADYNSQAKLGRGNTANSVAITSGGCDTLGMKSGTLNNDGKHSMIYRGIEDILGNIFQFVDGINITNRKAYISYTPSKYAVDKFNDSYYEVGYTNNSVNGGAWLGYNEHHSLVAFPSIIIASEERPIPDHYWQNSGNRITSVGGGYDVDTAAGLWFWDCEHASSSYGAYYGARLLKTI